VIDRVKIFVTSSLITNVVSHTDCVHVEVPFVGLRPRTLGTGVCWPPPRKRYSPRMLSYQILSL